MKIWLFRILWLFLAGGVIVVFYLASESAKKTVLNKPKVAIHADDENAFLTKHELLDRLKLRRLFSDDMEAKDLKVQTIERAIAGMAGLRLNATQGKHEAARTVAPICAQSYRPEHIETTDNFAACA